MAAFGGGEKTVAEIFIDFYEVHIELFKFRGQSYSPNVKCL